MSTLLHHQKLCELSAKVACSAALFEARKGSTNSLCGGKGYLSPGLRRGGAMQGRRAGQQVTHVKSVCST